MELFKHIVHNGFFVLHGEHPYAEIFCLILLTELLTGQTKKGKGDLIAEFFMVVLRDLHSFLIEEGRVCHLDCDLESVLMGYALLRLKNIERFRKQLFITDVLFFPVAGHCRRVLRHHLGPMDNIHYEVTHHCSFRIFRCWTLFQIIIPGNCRT